MITLTKSEEIELYIENKGKVSTREIMEKFQVSVPTIHRVFEKMSADGKVKRVHGGAVATKDKHESLFEKKLQHQTEEKKAICSYAAKHFVQENNVIGIDSGTTAFHLVDYINIDDITIITNGLYTASHAAKMLPRANTICSGGTVRSQLASCVGSSAIDEFRNKYLNVLFLTCSGMDPHKNTIYEVDSLVAEVKRMMIMVANRVVLLVTSEKLNTSSFVHLTDLTNIHDIICDEHVHEQVAKQYRMFSSTLHIASM